MPAGRDYDDNLVERRLRHLDMANSADRGAVARAHTCGAPDAHLSAHFAYKIIVQSLRAGQGASDALAHADRDCRRRCAVRHHVEMRVEGRHLIDLDQRKPHLTRQRDEMWRREMADAVLQQMQMLD